MMKKNLEKYKKTAEMTMAECYTGTCDCSSCMHAFPNCSSTLEQTDCDGSEPRVCLRARKAQ